MGAYPKPNYDPITDWFATDYGDAKVVAYTSAYEAQLEVAGMEIGCMRLGDRVSGLRAEQVESLGGRLGFGMVAVLQIPEVEVTSPGTRLRSAFRPSAADSRLRSADSAGRERVNTGRVGVPTC